MELEKPGSHCLADGEVGDDDGANVAKLLDRATYVEDDSMRPRSIVANLAIALVPLLPSISARGQQAQRSTDPSELRIPLGSATLHGRTIGRGQPVIVLHGGRDFDHGYLLPNLDRLQDEFRLIYYGQRGRGKSERNPYGLQTPPPPAAGDPGVTFESAVVSAHACGELQPLLEAQSLPDQLDVSYWRSIGAPRRIRLRVEASNKSRVEEQQRATGEPIEDLQRGDDIGTLIHRTVAWSHRRVTAHGIEGEH